jgi:S1-C subfamily serine protease
VNVTHFILHWQRCRVNILFGACMVKRLICAILAVIPILGVAAEHSIVRQYVHPVIITQPSQSDSSLQTIIGSGSVVTVAPGYVLTAGHVVPGTSRDQMFVVYNRKRVRAIPVKIDRSRDLALLSVDIACPCAPLATTMPEIDDVVVATGFPLYMTYSLQLLSVGNVQGEYLGNIVTTSTTAPGGSGGGVFFKEKSVYELIGVTVAIGSNPLGPRLMQIEQEYNWLTFSVPVSSIKTFLRGTPAEMKKAP